MRRYLCLFGNMMLLVASFAQGKIVVNNDEWTLSDHGFSQTPDAAQFALNVANWFTGGPPGNFLAYTNNFGFTGTQLANTLTSAGHTWTVSVANPLNLALMQNYDAIFLGGYYANINFADLIQYVQNGGCVYIAAGTGVGGASVEASTWNQFLNAFGLALVPQYNGVAGNIPINSPHPIFAGVNLLYQNNGNDVIDLNLSDPNNEVLVNFGGHGLYGVYVPEPASLLALTSALSGLLALRRRKVSSI